MHVVYCRLETADGNTRDFNFELSTKLERNEYDLVSRAYHYMLYYFSAMNEMSNRDLEFYDLYSPPFIKSVFIFKFKDKFLKLNYTDIPLSYQLSDFYPETGESTIISTQAREIYSILVDDFKIERWSDYKLVYSIFTSEEKSQEEEKETLSLVSAYGDDYTVDNEPEEDSLSLGASSVNYEEYTDKPISSSQNFDKLPIEERRSLLEELKNNLKNAIAIKDIRSSIEDVNKKLKYYSGIKKEIENFNIIIEKKEKERDAFKDIHWMGQNIYNQMKLYIKKKKKYEGDLTAYSEKLEKNKKDIASIIPDNIFKNKVFMPTILIAIITFILSWVMREEFWYLSGASILFFTISFYYLWGYIDYIEYIIKLKREKNFYEKKLIQIEDDFQKEFSSLELTLKKENIEDINIPLERYDELKAFDTALDVIKEKLQTYIAQKFSEDTQSKFESLIKKKESLKADLNSFDDLKLSYKEIEYEIIDLKKSIKNYEKEELDDFSLDDDIDEDVSEELTVDLTSTKEEPLEYKYELNKLKYYLTELKDFLSEDIASTYEEIKKDFFDIVKFSIHNKFSLDINFENNEFFFMSEKEIEWNKKQDEKFKIFLQYALIKYFSTKNSLTIFIDLFKLNQEYGISFSTYLQELSDSQIIYVE